LKLSGYSHNKQSRTNSNERAEFENSWQSKECYLHAYVCLFYFIDHINGLHVLCVILAFSCTLYLVFLNSHVTFLKSCSDVISAYCITNRRKNLCANPAFFYFAFWWTSIIWLIVGIFALISNDYLVATYRGTFRWRVKAYVSEFKSALRWASVSIYKITVITLFRRQNFWIATNSALSKVYIAKWIRLYCASRRASVRVFCIPIIALFNYWDILLVSTDRNSSTSIRSTSTGPSGFDLTYVRAAVSRNLTSVVAAFIYSNSIVPTNITWIQPSSKANIRRFDLTWGGATI